MGQGEAVIVELEQTLAFVDLCAHACMPEEDGVGSGAEGGSEKHHQGDGPTLSHGPVSMGKAKRAVCNGGLAV